MISVLVRARSAPPAGPQSEHLPGLLIAVRWTLLGKRQVERVVCFETQLPEFVILSEGPLMVEHLLEIGRRDVTDGFEEPTVVEQGGPFRLTNSRSSKFF